MDMFSVLLKKGFDDRIHIKLTSVRRYIVILYFQLTEIAKNLWTLCPKCIRAELVYLHKKAKKSDCICKNPRCDGACRAINMLKNSRINRNTTVRKCGTDNFPPFKTIKNMLLSKKACCIPFGVQQVFLKK